METSPQFISYMNMERNGRNLFPLPASPGIIFSFEGQRKIRNTRGGEKPRFLRTHSSYFGSPLASLPGLLFSGSNSTRPSLEAPSFDPGLFVPLKNARVSPNSKRNRAARGEKRRRKRLEERKREAKYEWEEEKGLGRAFFSPLGGSLPSLPLVRLKSA